MSLRALALAGLLLTLALPAIAQETTAVTFEASSQTAVFRISSILVEPSGLSLSSDVTEVLRKMELLTLAPSAVTLPNGDYWLNWGGTEEFNRSFLLHLDGRPQRVQLLGNRTAALWSLYAAGAGTLGTLMSAPFVTRDTSLVPVTVGAGVLAAGGLLGLALFTPRVEVVPTP